MFKKTKINILMWSNLMIFSCTSNECKNHQADKSSLDSLFDKLKEDTLYSTEYREDTLYSTEDILFPENGNSFPLYYAARNKDTTFVKCYLSIMDTVNFDKYHQLSLQFRERVFGFDYKMHGLVIEQLNDADKEIIRYNTMSIFWRYFHSYLLFNYDKKCFEVEQYLTENFAFYDRKYSQQELEEINKLMNDSCRGIKSEK